MFTKCSICLKLVASRQIIMHMKFMHNVTSVGNYKCTSDECDRFFSNKKSMQKHLRTAHVNLISAANPAAKKNDTNPLNTGYNEPFDSSHLLNSSESDGLLSNDNNVFEVIFSEESKLQAKALELISPFYADPAISGIQVQRIISSFESFLKIDYLNNIKEAIQKCETDEDKHIIINKLETYQNVLNDVNTEYKRLKVFENVGCLIKPKKLFFDTEDDKDKAGELRNKEKCGQIIPLDSVLKVFLELPSVFDTMRDYYLNLMQQADSINNMVQTNFWKSKIIEYPDRIIFPLFAYEDGYETGNH